MSQILSIVSFRRWPVYVPRICALVMLSCLTAAQPEPTDEGTAAPPDATDSTLPDPTQPYTGAPVPLNPTFAAIMIDPFHLSAAGIQSSLATNLGTDPENIKIMDFNVKTGALQFMILGDSSPVLGQFFASLSDEALAQLGIKVGSISMVNMAPSVEDRESQKVWPIAVIVALGVAVVALCAGLIVVMLRQRKLRWEEQSQSRGPRIEILPSADNTEGRQRAEAGAERHGYPEPYNTAAPYPFQHLRVEDNSDFDLSLLNSEQNSDFALATGRHLWHDL